MLPHTHALFSATCWSPLSPQQYQVFEGTRAALPGLSRKTTSSSFSAFLGWVGCCAGSSKWSALRQYVNTFKSSSSWDVLIQRHYTSERALWFPFSLKCCKEAVLHNRVGVTVFLCFFTSWRPIGLGMLTGWKNTCRSPVWSYARMGDSFSASRLAAGRASSSPEQQKLCHTWLPHAQLLGECHPLL